MPECVRVATQEYRQDSDVLAGFILNRCIEHLKATMKASEGYSAYRAESEGMPESEILSATTFGRRMAERYTKTRNSKGIIYTGIGLKVQGLVYSSEANDAENDVLPI
jgi:phage/plasmid-associated DNA primase